MNAEKIYKRRCDELEDIVLKQRQKIIGLNGKVEKLQKQSAAFVKHTIYVFQLCNVDWRDMVRLYDYCIEQEKLNDKRIKESC